MNSRLACATYMRTPISTSLPCACSRATHIGRLPLLQAGQAGALVQPASGQ